MEDKEVSWADTSKYIFVPIIILGVGGFCGWTATAISNVEEKTGHQIESVTSGILAELTGIRTDLQALRVEIAKLQVELKLHQDRRNP